MKYPTEFLTALSLQQHQIKYARLTILDLNDIPSEVIEGAITNGGPISIDGSSAIRRTCQLTIAVDRSLSSESSIKNPYWALKNKFKLEIGLFNNIDSNYPKIIYLDQGIYIINSFSISETLTHYNISISGRDKMSKLNGDMGGIFPVQTTLDTIEEVAKDGSIKYIKQPIYNIIYNMVHELGGEPQQNIIIEDLPAEGYELWNYIGADSDGKEMPMFLFRDSQSKEIKNMTINGDKKVYRLYNPTTATINFVTMNISSGELKITDVENGNLFLQQDYAFALKDIISSDLYNKSENFELGADFTLDENLSGRTYKVQKINKGETAGYHKTALIYPGDLIANSGETITSVLDKIKNLLGEFEYFYDINGKFIFRKKKNYVNGLFSPINGDTIEPFVEISQYSYIFDDKQLISSLSYSSSIDNTKNDFTIWGNKNSTSSQENKLPIHARYAIDKKPESYTTFPYYRKCFDRAYIIPHYLYQTNQENGNFILGPKLDSNTFQTGAIYNWELNENTSNGYIVLFNNGTERLKIQKPNNACDSIYVIENGRYKKASTLQIKNEMYDKYYLEICSIRPDNEKYWSLYCLNEERTDLKLNEYNYAIIQPKEDYYIKKDNLFVKILEEKQIPPINLDETYFLEEDSTTYYAEWFNKPNKVDWRELIYLMARDYYQHNQDPNYSIKLRNYNPTLASSGVTGYEIYYADLQGFWRQLYNPKGKSPQFIEEGELESSYKYWSRQAIYYPETLNFWIDFLDTGGLISNYSIRKIGQRQKIEQQNTSGVTAIFYKDIPNMEFIIMPNEKQDESSSYTPIFIQDNMKGLFNISSRGKSSTERIDELIWKYTCIAERVNITCIPLYFLEPNTRIKLLGEDYIINKITLPITHNGMMQITASKVIRPI